MGYSHRWFRQTEIDNVTFHQIARDFKKLIPKWIEIGIVLADVNGVNDPVIDQEIIRFNGKTQCNHQKISPIFNPWPSSNGAGIALSSQIKKNISFAGTTLESRCCDGECCAESFHFPRVLDDRSLKSIAYRNKYRQICHTAFKPYDVAVTACLIVAKHYLGEKIMVTSDGNRHQWFDAKLLCQMELGYGMEFELELC